MTLEELQKAREETNAELSEAMRKFFVKTGIDSHSSSYLFDFRLHRSPPFNPDPANVLLYFDITYRTFTGE